MGDYWDRLEHLAPFHRGLNKIPRDYYNDLVHRHRIRTMLDLGCGFGDTYHHLDLKIDYVGLDMTFQFLQSAYLRHGSRFVNGKAEQTPFADDQFEMVTCRAVLEHVRDPEPILAEMSRLATVLIVIVWFIEPGKERMFWDRRSFWNNRHSKERMLKGLPGWRLTEEFAADRHCVWVLQ